MNLSCERKIRILAAAPLLLASAWFACLMLAPRAIVRAQQSAPPATPAPAAQPPAVTENVLRAQSRVVRVDVIVTDKKGKYVHDLTAKDFHVFDNDKEQPIVNFSFGSENSSVSPERHYMILFFDDATMSISDQPRARQAALKFIDANAGPDRVMAVVDFTGALRIVQNFTADAERLKKAAATFKPSVLASDDSIGGSGVRCELRFSGPFSNPGRLRCAYLPARNPKPGPKSRRSARTQKSCALHRRLSAHPGNAS